MSSSIKKWDPDRGAWIPTAPKSHDGFSWQTPVGDFQTLRRSPFDPYIGKGSIWQRDVSSMPLATNSATQAAWVASHINYGTGYGATAINTSVFGTQPVHPVLIDSRLPNPEYAILPATVGNNSMTGYGVSMLSGKVIWPKWVDRSTMQDGQDSSVCIIDVGTGLIREYYGTHPVAGAENQYTGSANALSLYGPDAFDLGWPTGTYSIGGYSEDAYTTRCHMGMASVVGMHNWLGWIDIAGARRGEIDHAIAWTCANLALPNSVGEAIDPDGLRYSTNAPSWPAKGGDGDTANPSDGVPIHGQWARLPLTLDLSPIGPYPPFVRMVIRAIQKYGMVCTDSNNFVHAFNAEPGFYEKKFVTGVDPWSTGGDLYAKYSALNAQENRNQTDPFSMASFPWALTQWAPRHWGAPGRIAVQ